MQSTGFPRSDVQFMKPGDKVTVLNIGSKESIQRIGLLCALVRIRISVQSPLVVLKVKVRKGGDFFLWLTRKSESVLKLMIIN